MNEGYSFSGLKATFIILLGITMMLLFYKQFSSGQIQKYEFPEIKNYHFDEIAAIKSSQLNSSER